MMRGSTAAEAAERILAMGFLPFFSPHLRLATMQRGGAVVHARGVAGGDHAAFDTAASVSPATPWSRRAADARPASTMAGGASFFFEGSAMARISPL